MGEFLTGLIALAAATFFFYPLAMEGTDSECEALGHRAIYELTRSGTATASEEGRALLNAILDLEAQKNRLQMEALIRAWEKERKPNFPPALSCTLDYWRLMQTGLAAFRGTGNAEPSDGTGHQAEIPTGPGQSSAPSGEAPMGPSFDCTMARSGTEKAICASPVAANAEAAMAKAYVDLKNKLTSERQPALISDQRRWLHQFADACVGRGGDALFQCLAQEEQWRERFLADRSAVQIMTKIGPDAIWNPTAPPSCRGSAREACIENSMRTEGASSVALGLATYWQFGGYLTSLTEFGNVDVGIMYTPLAANNNEQPVLLNGDPPIIDVWAQAVQGIDLSHVRQRHPKASVDSNVPRFSRGGSLPNGGQRFTYVVEARECHACSAVATYDVVFDFNASGRFTGSKVINENIR